MSVAAILPNVLSQAYNLMSPNQNQPTKFQQLTRALQSGNLTNAQQAFSALTNGPLSSGLLSFQLKQSLNALGSALQSGNLADARNAYSSVQQSLQNPAPIAAHHHRPHPRGVGLHFLTSGFPDSTSSAGVSSSSPSNVFQPVNLTA
jgi:hypothetical protein